MANFFPLILDTTAPASPTIQLEGGAVYTSALLVNASITTGDVDTTGYQMKIWGDVDTTYDTDVQDTEVGSTWITFSATKQIKLATGDGSKTVYLRIRDDVHNVSAQATDSITLDTNLPVVTTTAPDVTKISKQAGKNICSFSFSVSEPFTEYKVKVVSSSGASHDTGVVIPTTAGSTNTSATGSFDTSVGGNINVQIYGTDLETASAGDGEKIIKVFAKDASGAWSS